MSSGFHNPLPNLILNNNPAENWKQWLNRFRIYLTATEVDKKPEKVQIAQLLHFAGPELQKIYDTLQFQENEDKNKINVVIEKLNKHFLPRENLICHRYQFFMTKQINGQSIEQYVTELKKQAANLN
uniref:Retrotransposon gag domain-containing protein n=1 Tax=Photinus pyralis TaxID=7054 RepID=A0A1Y1KAV0_PHOPY